MAVFTPDERERLRNELVSVAQEDPNLSGAAHTGSRASSRLDRWSDIDLAVCLRPDASRDQVVTEWTERLYRDHDAVAHIDVTRGPTLFRVFLLGNTLQVDVSFWRAEDFGATGPSFMAIFGQPGERRDPPQPNPIALSGMAWLYALHVRSSLARARNLQAEYMLNGMRDHVCQLACLRCGVTPHQGRGLDDLPAPERDTAAAYVPRSLESSELRRALQSTMRGLLRELEHVDATIAARLSGPLNEIVA